MNPHTAIHREARFLTHCGRLLMGEADVAAAREVAAPGLDSDRLASLTGLNHLGPLLYRNLRKTGLDAVLPPGYVALLQHDIRVGLMRGVTLEQATRDLLEAFHRARLPVILLRGLAVGERVYGDGSLRPYTDLDFLLAKEHLPAAKAILHSAGYRSPPTSLEDGYYERLHFHLLYAQAATGVVVEMHWALDHRYTLWLIDYREILQDAREGTLAGAPALLLSPEDMLLSLCIHFVKHCTCADALLERPDAAEQALVAGWWLHGCDVAETLRRYASELDGPRLADKARRWNIEPAVRAGLLCAQRFLRAPIPGGLMESLSCPDRRWFARRLQAWQLPGRSADALHDPTLPPRRKIFGFRRDLSFRPVRLLDLIDYLWPDPRYLARRHPGSWRFLRRPLHLAGALGSLTAGLLDLFRSKWRHGRKRRPS